MTPDDYTIQELLFDVGDGHQIYVHEWGQKAATVPILFLHGGPGSQTKDKHKNLFDPRTQRAIFFDQRGCGKSTPYGSLEHNTTTELVGDIEKIAHKLNLDKFIISGGSWGSCLALAYALEHPERVRAMVLHGIFTGSQTEIDWLDKGGFKDFYPDVWEYYLATIPDDQQAKYSGYHFRRILEGTTQEALESGYAYESLEGSVMKLDDRFTPQERSEFDPSGIRIEMHYMANRCFLPDKYIMKNAAKLTMPIWLVQGRYDMVCPPANAYELSKLLSKSHLIWTINGHHAEHESWNVQRMILAQLTEEE